MPLIALRPAKECHEQRRGQLSLEYMLVLAAFFSCLLLLLPAINTLYHTALFGMDVHNARVFADSLQHAISRAEIFAPGTSLEVSGRVLTEWTLSMGNNELRIAVESAELGKSKELVRALHNSAISIPEQVCREHASFEVLRSAAGVSVVNRNNNLP